MTAAVVDAELPLLPDIEDDGFITGLVDKCMQFMPVLVGHDLRPYQIPLARRIIESVLCEDAAELTCLAARQSGKTEVICNALAVLLILCPLFARLWPTRFEKFRDGLWLGVFAPTDGQAETLFSRLVDRLTSERAQAMFMDPDIDDIAEMRGGILRLRRLGSRVMRMTANPRAKIESQSFHVILIDEAQDCDDYVVRKSIIPMGAAYAATKVKTGTPTTRKGDFYAAIQQNKRSVLSGRRGAKQNHYQWDWREVVKHNKAYGKHIDQEREHPGEDSDEFQMAYNLKWLIERGMLTTETRMEELGDTSMQELVRAWTRTPVVVGIDLGKSIDSTVVTVVFVDWDRPDEFGFFAHRVLNWLEIEGTDYEQQYPQIINFLEPYSILAVAVDGNGVGSAVVERLAVLLRHKQCDVISSKMVRSEQSKRWKHLMSLMDRGMVGWPAGARVRRLRVWKRFYQQMCDVEKEYRGPDILVAAPNEAGAHDDYVDSLSLALACSVEAMTPEVEVMNSPFFGRREEQKW